MNSTKFLKKFYKIQNFSIYFNRRLIKPKQENQMKLEERQVISKNEYTLQKTEAPVSTNKEKQSVQKFSNERKSFKQIDFKKSNPLYDVPVYQIYENNNPEGKGKGKGKLVKRDEQNYEQKLTEEYGIRNKKEIEETLNHFLWNYETHSYETIEEAIGDIKRNYESKYSYLKLKVKLNLDFNMPNHHIKGLVNFKFGEHNPSICVITSTENVERCRELGIENAFNPLYLKEIEGQHIIPFEWLIFTEDVQEDISEHEELLRDFNRYPEKELGTLVNIDDLEPLIGNIRTGLQSININSERVFNIILGSLNEPEEYLVNNANTLVKFLEENKPSEIKGRFVLMKELHFGTQKASIKTTTSKKIKRNIFL